ncbi:YheV family putative zinc ribbon protein [Kangiella sediminilitoris]|uniref:DNA-binding protein n=1 Tax=Kangiella sediminilitoris TaxID=1144748 RepID=A0A1B3B7Q7_9GAMM|nr:YheV family putative zinc ribbon protein [Kangiella sediminilitoris]AOE48830.1 hypothetical protein KS2013_100 [Kangiella sediminilitoris]
MTQKSTPKRFVAGAKCPQCNKMDTTVCYYEDEIFVRECIECDFKEKISNDESGDDKPEKEISPAQIIKIKEL